jgi:small subunit ribosomal protein S9
MKKTIKKVKKEKPKIIKKIVKKAPPKEEVVKPKPVIKPEKYYEAVGRRKTAVAKIQLFTKGLRPKDGALAFGEEPRVPTHHPPAFGGSLEKLFLVNKKPLEKYFPTSELQKLALASLEIMKCLDKFRILAIVKGGGLTSLARALTLFNPDFRKRLKKAGFLKRDQRMKERKKFGLKRARKAPQWQKR